MPAPKKPRRETRSAPRSKISTAQALPDRRVMEEYLAAITEDGKASALRDAQDIIYDAWERATSRSRIALARKAIGVSPLCADAYNLLARAAATATEARDLYERGLLAGELALGPRGFEECDGRFWGYLKTRPYMRARHGLAMTLLSLGEEDAAVEHFRAMLALNPNDNQGIRYLLLARLLRRDDAKAVKILLAAYKDEWSVYWLYTRALLAWREGRSSGKAAKKLVDDAFSVNKFVPAILAGISPPVISRDGYVTMGGADEATEYVRECGAAWKETPGAIDWLAIVTAGSTTSRSVH